MIKKIIIGVILNGAALYAVTYILTDIKFTGGVFFFAIGGFVIGFLNVFVKPLMKVLSFPLMVMTIGLFSIVINAIIFFLMVKAIGYVHLDGVTVTITSTLTYVFAGIIFGLVNWFLHLFIHNK